MVGEQLLPVLSVLPVQRLRGLATHPPTALIGEEREQTAQRQDDQ